jgi:hypothetical protein
MLPGKRSARDRSFPHFCVCCLVVLFAACLACSICVQAQTVHPRLQSRNAIQRHLRSFSTENSERERLIRKWFAESGCKKPNLSEQIFDRDLPPNVICALPWPTQETIVIGAHTDKVDAGDGVVDNWTGAVLLPALFYSLSARSRHHTFIFAGFSAEERGLLGSHYYADHLTSAQRVRIEAMVNLDSLGLGPTEVWASHSDKVLLDALGLAASAAGLRVSAMDPPEGASADSESFVRYHIPRITLHSVTEKTWPILHSPFDTISEVRMIDYYDSYRLIADYLSYLDDMLKDDALKSDATKSPPTPAKTTN